MSTNKKIILKSRPKGMPDLGNFEILSSEMPVPSEGEVLLKSLYVSVDPYIRGRMNDVKSYVEPYRLNEVIRSGVVAEVMESKDEGFKKGDYVTALLGWEKFQTTKTKGLEKVDPNLAGLSAYLGILGMPGLTAYFGLMDIGKPKAGETVVVSGAAGAVGSVVGQIAKIQGCRVVGIAGSAEKCRFLRDELGFDAVINYREGKVLEDLMQVAPDGVDVYFDNVGGEISDAVISRINKFARIAICGQISLYNLDKPPVGPRVMGQLLIKSALMKGFIVWDYADRVQEGIQHLAKWLGEGKLKYRETVMEGFDNIPQAFLDLFTGKNLGKMVVKVE
ncbi:NADP-dependent oxidoreductase [Xanthovirga aplysinae]|uniref:NADP-dependent oxidoreductase n=1 Tax=Xanthovirga aplysinae TaxID=2529853 RepID=UPI0012BCFB84|nr:NADP-dependent oxidoreductase [Xanthovirga aplysinae]MTI30583.1 NADP-dependent oxidoreductase [Xanthovirga aplysinae]